MTADITAGLSPAGGALGGESNCIRGLIARRVWTAWCRDGGIDPRELDGGDGACGRGFGVAVVGQGLVGVVGVVMG